MNEPGIPAFTLALKNATLLDPAMGRQNVRPPFSLTFFIKDPHVLPQRIYHLLHQMLGEVSIFLVPSGKDAEGVTYQATFN